MKLKKVLTLILALAIVLSSMGTIAFADATVAIVNGVECTSLVEALNKASEVNGAVIIELIADVEWETGGGHGSTPFVPEESTAIVTINGNDNTIIATGDGVGPIRAANGTLLTFDNVNFVDNSVSYDEGAWEFTYLEFAGKLKFEDCDFKDEIQLDSESADFENCTFESNEESVYAVWVGNGAVTFTNNCYFTGYRGLKMHEAYGSDIVSAEIENCKFENITKKPGVAIGVLNDNTSVKISDCEFINVQAGDQGGYIFETDTDVTRFDFQSTTNNIVNGTITPGYTSDTRVWGEGKSNAKESYVVELYAEDEKIAQASLNDYNDIIDGTHKNVTWGIPFDGKDSDYWTVDWYGNNPSANTVPTKVVLVVDGVKVAENEVQMNGPDNLNQIVWKELDALNLKGEGTEENPYLINNLRELKMFRDIVDEQRSDGTSQFAGKYIKLTDDIDLMGENWNPIGSMSGDHNSFTGVFDGDGHTISNLHVEQEANGIGLFARTSGNAVIKNLTINNVTLNGTKLVNNKAGSYLGAVVGNSYASTKIENVHVTGNIDIHGYGYIGGITGHGYVKMDNVSVIGQGTINSAFWCAGGILGYGGEGATNITNAKVEGIGNGLVIESAAGALGAIVGRAEDNNGTQPISGSNLFAKNVKIQTYIGGFGTGYADNGLGYLYGGSTTSILTGDLRVENVTMETSTGDTSPEVVDAVAIVNDVVFFDLDSALVAAQSGYTIKLARDINDTITLGAEANDVIIDINGLTLNTNIIIEEGITVEIKNGVIINEESSNSAIETKGNTTINNLEIKSARHCVRVKGGLTTIKDGNYSIIGSAGMTQHAVNVSDGGEVVIYDGTFTGPKETEADSGSAVCVQADSKVSIYDGIFTNGLLATLDVKEGATLKISGGSFDQDPTDYVVGSMRAVKNTETGLWSVKKKAKPSGSSGVTKYTLTFETNGGKDVNKITKYMNTIVDLSECTTEKDGYTFDGWYADEDFNNVVTSVKLTRNTTVYAKWIKKSETVETEMGEENLFTDVKTTDWFYENVKFVNVNKLMNGMGERKFAPNDTLTRAMLVTILYRLEGEPETDNISFTDVNSEEYYANAVSWAKQKGIVNGVSETEFAPNSNITREQIATIIHRYADSKGYDVSVPENTNIFAYDDAENISEYAIASMEYAVGSGLINGKSEETLNPKDNATRAEIAAILQRFMESNIK